MKKIVIIGAGFAGLSALNLLRGKKDIEITLIDNKETSDFLPLLPDCIGRGINPDNLKLDISKATSRLIKEEVRKIDLNKKEVITRNQILSYDYLIIASGSETNFYGNEFIHQNAYKLDGVEDARRIIEAIRNKQFDNYVVVGGGYTGVEVATNLKIFLNKASRKARVVIVERAPAILGVLPEWMKKYVEVNLIRMGIEVLTVSGVEKIEGERIYLTGGNTLDNAFVVWAAGVKAAQFIQDLKVEKNPQGRIKVDEYLRLNESCFVVGDTAYVAYQNNFLRMAVQFAIMEGGVAAKNILKSIKGSSLIKYKPIDLGYVIPMANNRSCGQVFGVNLKGFLPTMLHFMMCIYRSYGIKNKLGIIGDLIKGR